MLYSVITEIINTIYSVVELLTSNVICSRFSLILVFPNTFTLYLYIRSGGLYMAEKHPTERVGRNPELNTVNSTEMIVKLLHLGRN